MYVKLKKILSTVLAITMLLSIFSSNVIALDSDFPQKSPTIDSQKPVSNEITEIEALRESNVKHFRLPDGSYQAVVYSQSIHRKDESGKWIDIDNHLTEETNGGNLQYSTSDSRIKFINNDKNYPIMTLSENGYSISMEFIGDTGSSAQKAIKTNSENAKPIVTNSTQRKTNTFASLEEAKSITNQTSIRYENLKNSTDIEYVLVGNDIKENIILNATADDYSYQFQLNLIGLLPSINKDGSISLNDIHTEKTIYTIPTPYMYDAVGNISYQVAYDVKEISLNSYSLTVCADENWINSPERNFPITIDPTIQENNIVWDSYISSANPNTNYGASQELWISSSDITFIKIEIPATIPAGSTITNATLNIPFYYYSFVTSGSLTIGAHEIYFPWEEYEITWNIADENSNMGLSSYPISTANLAAANSNGVNDPGIAALDITEIIQYWIDGDPNFGIALKYISGTNSSVILRSWEYSNSAESYYCITYYPIIDITLATDTMGINGTQQATYSTYPTGLTPTWSSSNTAVATVSSSGLITARSQGTTRISASCYDTETGNTYTDSVLLYVYDSTGIKNNTSYYIMNSSSERLLSLQSDSDSNHTNVYTSPRSATTMAKWTLEKQSDGTFQFICDYSYSSKCLNVDGTNVDIYSDIGASSSKFVIERVKTGTYQGLYLIRYGNQYLAHNTSNNNVYVTSSKSAAAYWSFMAVEKRSAEFFCHDYWYIDENSNPQHYNTATTNKDYFENVFNSYDFSANVNVNKSHTLAYQSLTQTADVFIFRGHGNAGLVEFIDENGISIGFLSTANIVGYWYNVELNQKTIVSIPDNGLQSLRMVFYIGCYTGKDFTFDNQTYNLVDSTFEKGAHFVLGTNAKIKTDDGNTWLEYFLENIESGMNIQDAIDYANIKLETIEVYYEKDDGSEELMEIEGLPIYSVGDGTQYLNIE